MVLDGTFCAILQFISNFPDENIFFSFFLCKFAVETRLNIIYMETAALNNLWRYIETLPLTSQNRQWLVDKLLSGERPTNEINRGMLLERLKALSELPEDWDDEGALPICPLVLQHTKSLIDAANDIDFAYWNLFPAINGTLTFQHENKDAMLSIGEDDFSFVFASDGRIVKAIDNAPFSITEILELIKMVNIN